MKLTAFVSVSRAHAFFFVLRRHDDQMNAFGPGVSRRAGCRDLTTGICLIGFVLLQMLRRDVFNAFYLISHSQPETCARACVCVLNAPQIAIDKLGP